MLHLILIINLHYMKKNLYIFKYTYLLKISTYVICCELNLVDKILQAGGH